MNNWLISGKKPYQYEIVKTDGIFNLENSTLSKMLNFESNSNILFAIDDNVSELYQKQLERYLNNNNVKYRISIVNAGDQNKNIDTFYDVFKEVCTYDLGRREIICSIGGGVVTDIVGLVASTYRRGIPIVKIPTTLMGYVDASVGIKTGINVDQAKNRLGTFSPPQSVILDRSFLKTVSTDILKDGLGEIIKLAVILDHDLFNDLRYHGESCLMSKFQSEQSDIILDKSISLMVEQLSDNLYEDNLERAVDFGHTFSLAIESNSNYQISHGIAVSLDIIISCAISVAKGLLSKDDFNKVLELYHTLNMQTTTECINENDLWNSLEERTKHRGGLQRVPLPKGLGNCIFVNDINRENIRDAMCLAGYLEAAEI
ncbi:sedoheptulose 7-phosphate cyclase [Mycoavidus sp. SF9855]|uniref:sedoheptulose 7-phosphate cyclase n=1 Tax=Mycoavidus sp. SF9855 TaxID=2968475 RepID=UPI00211BF240|nr:sedoheptulose 7-phosphate cyclase [Mycoavidus sp. SF9855]UUM22061.1 sedoheptulose 7-phosphate cyclase [Mycoavidus sp. SF9855]